MFKTTKFAISTFLIVMLVCVATPLIIVQTLNYWRKRADPAINKRLPLLVLLANLGSSVFVGINLPMYSIQNGYPLSDDKMAIIKKIDLSVYFVLHLCVFLYLIRLYFLCYNIRWTKSSHNELWKQLISTDARNKRSQSWIIRHRGTLGNPRWMAKWLILWGFCVEFVLVTCNRFQFFGLYDTGLYHIIDACFFAVSFAAIAVTFYLMPDFSDHFRIRDEMSLVVKTGGVALAVYILWILCFSLGVPAYPLHAINCVVFSFLFVTITYVSTTWVLYRSGVFVTKTTLMFLADNQSANDGASATKITVTHVLAHKDSFQLFMTHLLKEFSGENLLAVVEFTQFRFFAQNFFNIDSTDDVAGVSVVGGVSVGPSGESIAVRSGRSGSVDSTANSAVRARGQSGGGPLVSKALTMKATLDSGELCLYKGIPQSAIVFDDTLSITDKAIRLIQKYVLIGAEYELNLSSITRNRLKQLSIDLSVISIAESLSDEALLTAFDRVISELLRLMIDSFTRWKKTPDFNRLRDILAQRALAEIELQQISE